jgi:vacuolar-type H+-ATPase subunit E/Vma4
MQNESGEKSALIAGIENDAHAETDKIINEAKKISDERKRYAQKQVENILKDAEERAAQQYESIKRTILAGAKVEVSRKAMEIRKKVSDFIEEKVRAHYDELIKKPEYKKLLASWIVEAAIGLGAPEVTVNASTSERALLDKTLLAEAVAQIKKASGQDIVLKLSDQPALDDTGILLTTADHKTCYNNQLHTRMRRKQKDIQNLIYERLFSHQ